MQESESYIVKASEKATELLANVDSLKNQLDSYRHLKEKEHIWQAIQEKLRSEWTYHSNAIEGSALTLGETIFFLQYGLTVEGKPFKDFLDVRNHAEAIELLYGYVAEDRFISEGFIKEINALLLSGVSYTKAIDQFGNPTKKPATPGEYKKLPNTILRPDATIHEYIYPLEVPPEMEYLCKWIKNNLETQHPITTSAVAHYNMVRIHPFDDGNGRGVRILMNVILLKRKYPPAIIKMENRRKYIEAMEQGDKGDLNSFIEFVSQSLIDTATDMLNVLKNNGNGISHSG